MTGCDRHRDDLAELVLDVLPAESRASVVDHVSTCVGCEERVAAMRRVVDDLLLLAPAVEPPSGFETRALSRLPGAVAVRRLAPRRRIAAALAVAAIAAVALGVATGWAASLRATREERRLAASYQAQLDEAGGEYFVARQLTGAGAGAASSGVVFAYQGHPSWVLVTVRDVAAGAGDALTVTVRSRDGETVAANVARDASGVWSWGGSIPFDVRDTTTVEVAGAGGAVVLTARIH
jgi:hypothetical protein